MAGTLDRDTIVHALRTALEPLPYVEALVEGGAAAWHRIDAWSDIDLNVFIEPGKFEETFRAVEDELPRLSPIDHAFVAHGPANPGEGGMQQKFYRLKDAGPFLQVDLAVIPSTATEKFLEPELHGENVVYFDKTGVTNATPLNRAEFDRKMKERLVRLRGVTEMFHVFVEKEANRRNWIEAMDNYRAYVAGPLLELLRMKYGPLHHTFRSRYVHYELPPDVVARYQRLVFVKDGQDLLEKYPEALKWFHEISADLGVP
ncbi:MAG: hypothetical protein E6K18_00010 [Methanobacteriota archaeon]|nr:MAG: hypothetical protein E6K18_00010 [Euryarchaeota archaeon]